MWSLICFRNIKSFHSSYHISITDKGAVINCGKLKVFRTTIISSRINCSQIRFSITIMIDSYFIPCICTPHGHVTVGGNLSYITTFSFVTIVMKPGSIRRSIRQSRCANTTCTRTLRQTLINIRYAIQRIFYLPLSFC